MGEVLKCIQITGYLIFLDPQGARYYQLVGICLQRLKQYEAADFYYKMALILEPADPMSLVYRVECKILAGSVDAGLAIVREGLEIAKKNPDAAAIHDRAQALIKQFGA
jgi:tetratricopeptide (TPR) repeat protein